MQRITLVITFLLFVGGIFAQAPQSFSYQAVIRNSNGVLLANTPIAIFISIAKDSASGDIVFGEIQKTTTNANGLASVAIGTGNLVSGSFTNINWGSGKYYIKTAVDPTGGSSYTISGSSQLLSVPYALYAANGAAAGKNVGDMQYWDGTKWIIIPIGSEGTMLAICNGIPTWGGCAVVVSLPTVTATSVTAVASTTATAGGNVTSNGGATVTARGVCYATTSNPTTANTTLAGGTGTGSFTSSLTGLSPNTTYYLRAYAANSAGTAYSSQVSFTTISAATVTVGQSYAGGIVFYVDGTGQHGLVAANSDQSGAMQWWNGSYLLTGASGTAVGTGQTNTASIINVQATGNYAANICNQPLNGYSDWFLPAKEELKLMYTNLHTKGLGAFTGSFYYSSSEYDVNEAWVYDFGQNSQFAYYKNNTGRVRAVRKF